MTLGPGERINDHWWCQSKNNQATWLAEKASGRRGAYFTATGFAHCNVSRFKGRTQANALVVPSTWIDVEGSADKYERNPDGGYPDGKAALAAVVEFVKATGYPPSFLVATGSGGYHLHYVLDAPITPDVWIGRARALVALARKYGSR